MNRRAIRKVIERFPMIANAYRELRDRNQIKKLAACETSYGIVMLGGNYIAAGAQESVELSLAEKCLDETDVVIDVGANSGIYTCLAASRGKHVLAIEPSRDNLAIFFENLRLNSLKGVEAYPIAVSDCIGMLPFYGRGQGASLISGWGDRQQRANIVPVNTLDNIVGDRFPEARIFMKVDVEGVEFLALSGAKKLLARCTNVMIEISLTRNHPSGINPEFIPTFELLWASGFEAYTVNPDPVLITSDDLHRWKAQRNTGQEGENFWFRRSGQRHKA